MVTLSAFEVPGVDVIVEGITDTQPVSDLNCIQFFVVLKITSPSAELPPFIASLCVVVIRGGKKPFVVERTSNCAEGFTFAVVTPIPTWALVVFIFDIDRKRIAVIKNFFILVLF
jgi:hypothetical protein